MNRNQENNDMELWPIFRKMLFFTILMVVGPISSYFFCKNYIFDGKS